MSYHWNTHVDCMLIVSKALNKTIKGQSMYLKLLLHSSFVLLLNALSENCHPVFTLVVRLWRSNTFIRVQKTGLTEE